MTIGSILLGLALLVLVGMYIARPILTPSVQAQPRESRYKELVLAKESALIQIRNLDFDFQTGKIPEDLYEPQRAALVEEAAAILKEIDGYEQAAMSGAAAGTVELKSEPEPADIDADIEEAVRRIRQSHRAPSTVPPVGKPLSAGSSPGGETSFCPQCGEPAEPDDNFCVNCGAKLRDPQLA
ncbi:MAG: zinc-ribbon domain-containing protein [Candidatus Promineifilaceae bacterium]